jgi:anti-sigma regulatory factor (Ser/Thr protein kinase)
MATPRVGAALLASGTGGIDATGIFQEEGTWVLMSASEFRAVVLELVTNAAKAGARTIRIRARRGGSRFWLMVGDDGSGFSDAAWTAKPSTLPGLHGTGMHRSASAVGLARGKLRIRSQAGRGSAVAVILLSSESYHRRGRSSRVRN